MNINEEDAALEEEDAAVTLATQVDFVHPENGIAHFGLKK